MLEQNLMQRKQYKLHDDYMEAVDGEFSLLNIYTRGGNHPPCCI